MKNLKLTLLALLVAQASLAQLNKTFTQYSLMPYMINAGASGVTTPTEVKLVVKRPFGIDDTAARDNFLGINHGIVLTDKRALYGLVDKEEGSTVRPVKLGLSGYVRQLDFNALTNMNGAFSISIHIPISRRYYVSFGLSTSYNQLKVKTQNLIVREILDTYFTSLTSADGTINNLDLGSGIMLYSNKLFAGYSVDGLLSSRLESNLNSASKPALTHNLMLSYKTDVNSLWEFHPAVLVRYQVGTPIFYNISAKFRYRESAWLGMSFISGQTMALLTGYEVSKSLTIGYAYDVQLGNSNSVLHNANEIILGFKPFVKNKETNPVGLK